MNPITENAMVRKGILFPTGEPNLNKLNLISGATIPQFCDFFWEVSLRDKELVNRLRTIMQKMYDVGNHGEMLDVLFLLYGLVGLEFPDELELLKEHSQARSYFLREMLLDFADVFDELIALSDAGIE
ncbi:MAG: hypothetical protein PHF61_08330 [Bacteroidales bacterium]|nr:hypothetical protein [Bacteroidales bacterium]